MTPFSRFVIAVAMASLPFLAGAEGKCGDDPYKIPDTGKLVVTWTLPVPVGATVTTGIPDSFFTEIDRIMGAEIGNGVLLKLKSSISDVKHPVEHLPKSPSKPAESMKASPKAVADWETDYGIAQRPIVKRVFEEYFGDKAMFAKGFQVYASLVEHPPAQGDGLGFDLCTCALQRGVVTWDGGKETLYVRSTFHSEKSESEWHNLRPTGVKVAFDAPRVWFPLRLNRVLPDPGTPAFLVVDVLVTGDPQAMTFPGMVVSQTKSVTVDGKSWKAVRLTRTYRRGDDSRTIDDLWAQPPP